MNTLAIFSWLFLLLPESALACTDQTILLTNLVLKSPMAIFFNIGLLLIITFPLGLVSGRTVRRLSRTGKIVALTLVTTGLLMAGGYKAWACHGTETVGPFLEKVFAAQLDYHEKIWDQAAGSLVVEEAGGRISDLDGRPLDFTAGRTLARNRGVLASNGHLHEVALQALRQVRQGHG